MEDKIDHPRAIPPALRAELVVASACDTAAGPNVRGEGVINFARGFLRMGVPNVIRSLWPINEESAAEFMCRFYDNLLGRRLSPAAALLRARIALAGQKRWRDPVYWAGFSLVGFGDAAGGREL